MATVSLGPAVVDLVSVRAGDRNQVSITLSQDGEPMDLAGLTFTAQARKNATDVGPAALEAVVAIADAAGGKLTVRWPGDAVRAVLGSAAKWTGVWDLQYAASGQDPTTVAAGRFEVETDVTR